MTRWIIVLSAITLCVLVLITLVVDSRRPRSVSYYYDGELAVHCWVSPDKGGISCWPEKFVRDPAPGIAAKPKKKKS